MNISSARNLEKQHRNILFKFFDTPIFGEVLEVHELSTKEEGKSVDEKVASAYGAGEVLVEPETGGKQWYPIHFLSFEGEDA